jgi:hypothetical protein
MIRFFFRMMALVLLAIAVLFAVLDATRSIAASELVMTPLGESWAAALPETLDLARSYAERVLHPMFWDPVIVFVLGIPGFLVFGLLSLAFYAIGRKPARRFGGFIAES